MKQTRFTEKLIVAILKQQEAGRTTKELRQVKNNKSDVLTPHLVY
jgi:hypothetical protein